MWGRLLGDGVHCLWCRKQISGVRIFIVNLKVQDDHGGTWQLWVEQEDLGGYMEPKGWSVGWFVHSWFLNLAAHNLRHFQKNPDANPAPDQLNPDLGNCYFEELPLWLWCAFWVGIAENDHKRHGGEKCGELGEYGRQEGWFRGSVSPWKTLSSSHWYSVCPQSIVAFIVVTIMIIDSGNIRSIIPGKASSSFTSFSKGPNKG